MTSDRPDSYCYPGTTVLRNYLDLTDADELAAAEQIPVGLRSLELFAYLPSPPHDLNCLLSIHRKLFEKLYPFAGEVRVHTGRMTKIRSTGSGIVYGDSDFILEQLSVLFRDFSAENALTGLSLESFAQRAAHFYGEFDAVHPFREGNSRTLRIFFSSVAKTAGFRLGWDAIDATEGGRQQLYTARDIAVMRANSAPLAALFASILSPV